MISDGTIDIIYFRENIERSIKKNITKRYIEMIKSNVDDLYYQIQFEESLGMYVKHFAIIVTYYDIYVDLYDVSYELIKAKLYLISVNDNYYDFIIRVELCQCGGFYSKYIEYRIKFDCSYYTIRESIQYILLNIKKFVDLMINKYSYVK